MPFWTTNGDSYGYTSGDSHGGNVGRSTEIQSITSFEHQYSGIITVFGTLQHQNHVNILITQLTPSSEIPTLFSNIPADEIRTFH